MALPRPAFALSGQLPIITLASLALVAMLCVGITYLVYGSLISVKEQVLLDKLGQQQAELQVQAVQRFITTQQQQLDLFANRESVNSALTQPSPELLATVKNSLQKAFPDAISLRLFSLDRRELISGVNQQPSFIELDMINRAELRRTVTPEAFRLNNSLSLLFITPVAVDQQTTPIGTLLLALPLGDLQAALQEQTGDLGSSELQQRAPYGDPLSIISVGQASSSQSFTKKITDSNWQIKFTPSAILTSQTEQSAWALLLIAALSSIGLLGATLLLCRRFDPVWADTSTDMASFAAVLTGHAAKAKGTDESMINPLFQNNDILDIQVADEDQDLLALATVSQRQGGGAGSGGIATTAIPHSIFRAYDIRGVVGTEITPELTYLIGQAVGTEVIMQGQTSIFVARDGRHHSAAISDKLIDGLISTGCNVIDLGAVPTPLLYFATCTESDNSSGIMVTASHNPPADNGFKIVINGVTLADDAIQAIYSRIVHNNFYQGSGSVRHRDLRDIYIERIFSDIALAGDVRIVIDAGNGITGAIAPRLFEELGCDVIPLYCDVDGDFPNHPADPSQLDNLQDLIAKVKETGADLGVAFDGDGDRIGVVTSSGTIILPDRLLMLFAKDIVTRHPGCDVLFDVKSSRELKNIVSSYGGRPIMWKTGHSHMKAKMQETGALIGGELSGHIFIKDRWYGFDDGMYAACRLLEIMTLRDQSLDDIFVSFPALPATPEIKIAIDDSRKFAVIEQLAKTGDFASGEINTLDGLRADFAKGWGLARASNTSPYLTLRFEGESEAVITQLQILFKRELLKIDNTLDFPF